MTVEQLTKFLERLLALSSLAQFDDEKAMQNLAHLIDLSFDFNREDGTEKAFAWIDELEKRPVSGINLPLLDYFHANAWTNRQRIRHLDQNSAWQWQQPEALQQILALRRASRRPEFAELPSGRQAEIWTNLGNQLNSLGRFAEAVPTWNRALQATPNFGMALGNRGLGFSEYARSLYDPGHQEAFLLFAHRDLSAALSDAILYHGPYDDAKAAFKERKERIEAIVDIVKIAKEVRFDGYPLGQSSGEQRYRNWVLSEGLFLNPLNDLGSYSIAAQDVFTLPSFTTGIHEPPTLIGLFNQMKQEYISARWFLFEGMEPTDPHFADKGVVLYNTLDYPSYSIAVERVKAAYRIAYALFDKIAFFLNDYAQLNIKLTNVYFRTVWYENQDARRGVVRDELLKAKNWPFRGLFWLSKDLFDPSLQDGAEPDAQELYVIRNCLEHRYLKVHEMLLKTSRANDLWTDRLAYSVGRDDFYRKTLRVLKLARAALIYLSLGMHSEERRRAKDKADGIIAPMILDLWEDKWKR